MAEKRREEMTEEEVAEFYQARKGDMSDWVAINRPVRRRGAGATSTFAVRLTPEEIMELKAAADARQISMSEFIRNAALGAARKPGLPDFTAGAKARPQTQPEQRLVGDFEAL